MYTALKVSLFTIAFALSTVAAQASQTYVVTVTNAGAMPLSPLVIYTLSGQAPKSKVGTAPTPGFVQVCQTGATATRIQELAMSTDVTFKTQPMGMVMPGEVRTVEVEVNDPATQSIQIETMYGKTKDICALGSVGSHALVALKQHVTPAYLGHDEVVQTGAFMDPQLPMGNTYLDPQVCAGAMDAVTCLRKLAAPNNMGNAKIRYFTGYLSSVTMALENTFGAQQVLGLHVPTSGAVQFDVKLKH